MPMPKRQLARLDQGFIPHTRIADPTARSLETYLRQRLWRWEDAAVRVHEGQYRAAYRDLRAIAEDAAERHGIARLETSPSGQAWKAEVVERMTTRLNRLTHTVAASALRRGTMAWTAGYYGRLWWMDTLTNGETRIHAPPPDVDAFLRREGLGIREDVYDDLIRSLMGRAWRDQYATEIDTLVLMIKRTISQGMTDGQGVSEVMRRVRDTMGVTTDRRRGAVGSATRAGFRANFNRVQTITRTVINRASNDGSYEAYRANADILSGYQWLAARDERVCPQCRGYDGTVYALSDYFRPPAHPQCRCTIIPVITPALLLPPTARPPVATLGEWLIGQGVQNVLQSFLSNTPTAVEAFAYDDPIDY